MSFFLILIWFLYSIAKVCYSNDEFCSLFETNIQITKSFRFGQYSVLFTKDSGVFRFNGLHFDGKQLKYESVNEWVDWWGKYSQLYQSSHMFDMKYQNNTVRIFATMTNTKQKINYFTTYAIGIDNNVTTIEFIEEVTIDAYNYAPQKDPLNLKTVFDKFPQKNIEHNLLALMSFPYNDAQMPTRLLVYYKEKNPKNSELVTKVHILYKTIVKLPELDETTWKRDEKSGYCFDSEPVNSALLISDYETSGDSKSFFMVEFSEENYSVKKVMSSVDRVTTPFTTVHTDSITRLFGCVPNSTTTEHKEVKSTVKYPQEKGEKQSDADYWVMLIAVIIFGILSFASVVFLIYLLYKFITQE